MLDVEEAYAWLARARSYRYVFSEDPMRPVIDTLVFRGRAEWLGGARVRAVPRERQTDSPSDPETP